MDKVSKRINRFLDGCLSDIHCELIDSVKYRNVRLIELTDYKYFTAQIKDDSMISITMFDQEHKLKQQVTILDNQRVANGAVSKLERIRDIMKEHGPRYITIQITTSNRVPKKDLLAISKINPTQ